MNQLQTANQEFMESLNIHPSQDNFYREIPDLENRFEEVCGDLNGDTKTRLHDEYFGWGPIEDLLDNEGINEIVVNSYQDIYYEIKGFWHQHAKNFLTELTYFNFILRVCHESGLNFDQKFPFLCGKWQNFRVHISEESVSGTHCMSLRRHPKEAWSFSKLLDLEWCGDYELETLQAMISENKNLLIVGPTGSGKTSVINACLQEMDFDERCIILEDSDELKISNPLSIKLLTREESDTKRDRIDLSELVKQSLRMRPDRLVLGEVRGKEAKDLLMALATGHRGSIASLHANSAQEAILRLEMLIQLGAPNWSIEAIRRLILLSVDAVVVVGKTNGKRALKSVWSPHSVEKFGMILNQEI